MEQNFVREEKILHYDVLSLMIQIPHDDDGDGHDDAHHDDRDVLFH